MTDPKEQPKLTPAEERAVPGAHYSAGRRYSRISKAWVFAEHWNDREEVARLTEVLAASLAREEALAERVADANSRGMAATARVMELEERIAELERTVKVAHDLLGSLTGYDLQSSTARDKVGAAFVYLRAALSPVESKE